MQYCLSQSAKIGVSKRADKASGIDTGKYIYSVSRLHSMRDFVTNFAGFMRENYPEIKMVRDIEVSHFNAFFKARGNQWSNSTRLEYQSKIHKLGLLVNNVFNLDKDFSVKFSRDTGYSERSEGYSGRDKAMSLEHVQALTKELEEGESCAKWVPAVAYAIGARSEEIRSIRPEDIDLKKGVVKLRNCKNGRNRDVPIRKEYRSTLKNVKDYLIANNWVTVTNGYQGSAVNAAIRRAMHRIGISDIYPKSSVHAIRKRYATERFLEERSKGLNQRDAFTAVCRELGHNKYRPSLFNVYVERT